MSEYAIRKETKIENFKRMNKIGADVVQTEKELEVFSLIPLLLYLLLETIEN